jgi:hypothetical protein
VLVRIKNWERYGLKSWIEAAKRRLHHSVLAIALERMTRNSGSCAREMRVIPCTETLAESDMRCLD